MAERDRLDPARPLLGKWTVITGGSKGIGYGIAEGFVDAGAHVGLVARNTADLESAAAILKERALDEQDIKVCGCDITDPDSVTELFEWIGSSMPRLDVFVANAGSGTMMPFLDISNELWASTLALNLTGTFLCVQGAARMMQDSSDGDRSILITSSIRAGGTRPGTLAYSVTKAGVNQLARVAAYELAGAGVRVNLLSPGITATPLSVEGNPEVFARMAAMVPLGRAGLPGEMAAAAVYLSSPGAGFVTGANIAVDGGESLW